MSPSRVDELERLEQALRNQSQLAVGLRPLRESQAWQVLRQAMLGARRQVMETHTKALLKGDALNQRQLDYDRGYWDGIIQLLEQPWRAQEILEKTIERIEKVRPREDGNGNTRG